jgi:hypothetical protein
MFQACTYTNADRSHLRGRERKSEREVDRSSSPAQIDRSKHGSPHSFSTCRESRTRLPQRRPWRCRAKLHFLPLCPTSSSSSLQHHVTVHFTSGGSISSPKSVHARCKSRLIRTKISLSLRSAEQPPHRVAQPSKQSQQARSLFALLDRESWADCDSIIA